MDFWFVDTDEQGRITLTAPNGAMLFAVSPATALMLSNVLREEAEAALDDIDVFDEEIS